MLITHLLIVLHQIIALKENRVLGLCMVMNILIARKQWSMQ